MRHPALSYTPRLLMLGTQQVLHHFDRREGRNGHVHEDRIPLGHGAVPQAGKFLRAQIAAAARLRRNEARRRIGVPAPVSYTHLRAHETKANLVCRLLLDKKKTLRR